MVFTIFNIIAFRSEDGAMWNIAQPDRRLSLTTIPTRLFTYLLENADKMVGREELLNNIWDKYGLEPSNNSVNQYISLIRKSLSELGCEEEIIKTIPRVGFYIAGEMVSYCQETEQNVTNAPTAAPLATKQPRRHKWLTPLLLGTSVIISTLLVLQPFRSAIGHLDYSFPRTTLYKMGTIASCPVYGLTPGSTEFAVNKVQLAKNLAAVQDISCNGNEVFIFKSGEHYVYQQSDRAFLARCTINDNSLSHFTDCKAIYAYAK